MEVEVAVVAVVMAARHLRPQHDESEQPIEDKHRDLRVEARHPQRAQPADEQQSPEHPPRRLAHAHEDRQLENAIEEQRANDPRERVRLVGETERPRPRGGTEREHEDVAAGEDGAAGERDGERRERRKEEGRVGGAELRLEQRVHL